MYGQIPYAAPTLATKGASLLGKINWSSLLSNAGKTLNVVNQAIPLYYQVKPVIKNLKAIGKIGKEFTKVSSNNINNTNNNEIIKNSEIVNKDYNESYFPKPMFFV